MRMVKLGTLGETTDQNPSATGFGGEALSDNAQKFNPNEDLLTMDELNIGSAFSTVIEETPKSTEEGEEPAASIIARNWTPEVSAASATPVVMKPDPSKYVEEPVLPIMETTFSTISVVQEPDLPAMDEPGHILISDEWKPGKEIDDMPLHGSVNELRLSSLSMTETPRVAGEDVWMEIIENHPELSYHQAEILRQVAGMTPDTMEAALDRCGYLLERMNRLGPAALNIRG